MMTQQLQVSILTAPVAAIDRRALSQAWYSALHLVERPAPAPARISRENGAVQNGSSRRASVLVEKQQKPSTERRMPAPAVARQKSAVVDWDRRAPRSLLARRIERALVQRQAPATPVRTAFTVGQGPGRVHIMLQNRSGRMRLVALCLPSMRAAVARALDQARYALASRGIAVESCF
jgi:hypothetical protein